MARLYEIWESEDGVETGMFPADSTHALHEETRRTHILKHRIEADTVTEASAIYHELTGAGHRSQYRGMEGYEHEDGVNPFVPPKGPNPWNILADALQLTDELILHVKAHVDQGAPLPPDVHKDARRRMNNLLKDYFYNG